MSLEEIRRLRQRLNEPGGAEEYAALLLASKDLIAEWRWAASLFLPYNPHDRVVTGAPIHKWLKSAPRNGAVHHGLDGEGRVIVSRHFYDSTDGPADAESFFIYDEGGFWELSFRPIEGVHQRCDVQRFNTAAHRWLGSLRLWDHHVAIEESLLWAGDQLQRHSRCWWKGLTQTAPESSVVYDYVYDSRGELVRVDEHWESAGQIGKTTTKYLRLPAGVTLKSLLIKAEEDLVRDIPLALQAGIAAMDVVEAVLMEYTGTETDSAGSLPPLVIVTSALKQRILTEKPAAEWPYYIWSSPEARQFGASEVICQNPELEETLQLIFQLTINISNPRYAPVRKMFQNVCTRLNLLDWKQHLRTSDDFVIVPVDVHGEIDFDKDVIACIPPSTVNRLRSQCLLSTKSKRKPRNTES